MYQLPGILTCKCKVFIKTRPKYSRNEGESPPDLSPGHAAVASSSLCLLAIINFSPRVTSAKPVHLIVMVRH